MIRMRGLFTARRADKEFEVELESHIDLHTEANIRAGLPPEEARRQALIRLGGAEQTRQAYRERRTLPWLESLARDFTYGIRTLAKHPSATAIAVLSIGLGIGANATIFSMVSRFVCSHCPSAIPPRCWLCIQRMTAINAAITFRARSTKMCATRPNLSPGLPRTTSCCLHPSAAAENRSASGDRRSPPTSLMWPNSAWCWAAASQPTKNECPP